jgi:hypothetical protein
MQTRHRHLGFFSAIFAAALAIFTAASASAQTTFTVTATANATGNNYIQSQSYTFVITSGASFASNDNDDFSASGSYWYEYDSTNEDQMVTALGGTGLNGTYVRPTPANWNELSVESTSIRFRVGPDSNNPMGITKLDGSNVRTVYFNINSGVSFTPSDTYVEPFGPTGYFSAYVGSSAAGGTLSITDFSSNYNYFTVTNLAIAVSAVPEPSTYAAFAGIVVLGFVAYRRRQRTVNA